MPGRPPRNPIFWFVPALLACVLVLSGLCLFLIRGQTRTAQSLLREQERLSLDQTQQQFRRQIETQWQKALRELPPHAASYAAFRQWDQQLEEPVFGFCLDDSGLLVYPNFQLLAQPGAPADEIKEALNTLLTDAIVSRDPKYGGSEPGGERGEENYRRMVAAAERMEQDKAIALAMNILTDSSDRWINGGVLTSLPASVILLELEEISEKTMLRQAALVDIWLNLYEEGRLPLSAVTFPWLKRMQEQCRRRNEMESWLLRERRVSRLVQQVHWAEKFLPRLNLLLRRHLYNPKRTELPLQILNSDPAEAPFLLLCRFQVAPSIRLVGVVVDLETFCQRFERAIDQADWRAAEVRIRIVRPDLSEPHGGLSTAGLEADRNPPSSVLAEGRASSASRPSQREESASNSFVERRILDPWAPQFLVEARPRDLSGFERRALQKNLLYLTLVALTIASCILVLFLGSRAFQEQQRLSKLRSDFLTNVSHELRTPLTAIRLHAETLERQLKTNPSPAKSSLETIVSEVDRLSLLINDVLEFTRLENDKKRYLWESVDLAAVIRESMQLFSQQLAELRFQVSLDLPDSLVLERADRAALKQCAVNLISNSLKFSPRERYLAVRLRAQNHEALLEMEDRGIGIKSEDRPYIFDKFYRGTGLDPALSGTGLGLTLCKAFVEAHGGTIAWENPASGIGSLLVIRLPITHAS
jgi:signal transduction histidine kinase